MSEQADKDILRQRAEGLFPIGNVGKGQLSLGPRPLLQNYAEWLAALKRAQISRVVCLVSRDEVRSYGLEGQARALADEGIGFTHFPIDDFQTPDPVSFRVLIDDLSDHLNEGGHVFVHCAGGIGRAGTAASCLLVEHGLNADDAMAKVSGARGETCPETPAQIAFVRSFKR